MHPRFSVSTRVINYAYLPRIEDIALVDFIISSCNDEVTCRLDDNNALLCGKKGFTSCPLKTEIANHLVGRPTRVYHVDMHIYIYVYIFLFNTTSLSFMSCLFRNSLLVRKERR